MVDVRPDDIEMQDLATAGLPGRCVVRLTSLMTIRSRADIRRHGTLAARDRRVVGGLVKRWFGV
jgi:hypothetical protein